RRRRPRREGAIPSPLELGDHEAVLGLDGIVLPLRPLRRVARRLELQLQGLEELILLCRVLPCELIGGFERAGLHHLQGQLLDAGIDVEPAEVDAARLAATRVGPAALVAMHAHGRPAVVDDEPGATASAAQQPREQRLPHARRAGTGAATGLTVAGHQRLDALERRTAAVALVP